MDRKRKDIPTDAHWLARVVLSPLPHSRSCHRLTTRSSQSRKGLSSFPLRSHSSFTAINSSFCALTLRQHLPHSRLLQQDAHHSRSAHCILGARLTEDILCADSRDAPPTTSTHPLLRLCKGRRAFRLREAHWALEVRQTSITSSLRVFDYIVACRVERSESAARKRYTPTCRERECVRHRHSAASSRLRRSIEPSL